jgi:hypothetical protein
MVNWSEDLHTPLVDGGLLNHTNWYFEARNTVVNEQRLIEREENEKRRKDAERKAKKPSGKRRSGLGRRRAS